MVGGHQFPLEAHIVSRVMNTLLPACGPKGCLTVVGVLFELSDDLDAESAFLKTVFDAMPDKEGVSRAEQA